MSSICDECADARITELLARVKVLEDAYAIVHELSGLQDNLLACYRLGVPPKGTVLDRMEKLRAKRLRNALEVTGQHDRARKALESAQGGKE